MSAAQALRLDDELLYLFTFGPGFGETILVRAPPSAWLVVDSLRKHERARERNPALELVEHVGEPIEAIALTHPHLDHADGLPSLLARRATGAAVGCFPRHVDDSNDWRSSPDAQLVARRGAVEAAIAAIASAWADDPGCRWDLHAGEARAFGAATAEVLHPPAGVSRPRDLNAISSPMLVRYGDTRVLLGADLPRPGWARIGAGHAEGPTMRDAAALKASHHGSKPAQHAVAIGVPPRRDRFVTLTPFNRGERLPRFEADHGIAELLACHEEVHLTASPVALPALGHRHSRADIDAAQRRS